MKTIKKIRRLVVQLRREHNECEDPFYTCPKHPDSYKTGVCECGKDDDDKIIDEIIVLLATLKPDESFEK